MFSVRSLVSALAAAVLLSFVGASTAPCPVSAQGTCSDTCKSAYGTCYRTTSNRAGCEAEYQRCLQGCISSKRN